VIAAALKPEYDATALRERVAALAAEHPLYPGLTG
jgi:glycine hydroxymethyltransferase